MRRRGLAARNHASESSDRVPALLRCAARCSRPKIEPTVGGEHARLTIAQVDGHDTFAFGIRAGAESIACCEQSRTLFLLYSLDKRVICAGDRATLL